ncbi:AI-2E family transporter [Haloferax sp. DFSO60]|uniref:AI-2E family transporter n=1 Tax=Haloferax sp. DFSO60 TaxID=3388652 RepID=UPI00397B8C8F
MSRGETTADRVRQAVEGIDLGWWVFALVIGGVVVFVGWVYLPWVVFGLFVYYVARPIEKRLEGRVPSKNIAAGVTLLLVVLPIIAILVGALAVTFSQLSTILTDDVIARLDGLLPVAVGSLPTDPNELFRELVSVLSGGAFQSVFTSLSRTVGSVASALFNMFLALLFAFFLLREDTRLAAWFAANIADEETATSRYLATVDQGLQSIYFGYTITIFVVMILAAVVYSVFNLIAPPGMAIPSPIALAVITGVFTIVPLVGRSIVYAVLVGYLAIIALQTNPRYLWFPLVVLAVMELPFDNLIRVYIRPALSGKLFPMSLVMFAYLIGPALFGWYGIFFGPFLMVVVVLFIQLELPRMLHPSKSDSTLGLRETWNVDGRQTRLDEIRTDIDDNVGTSD